MTTAVQLPICRGGAHPCVSNRPGGLAADIPTAEWMFGEGGALDIDNCPDCWERRAHIERYEFACMALGGSAVLDFGCGCGFGSRMLAVAGNRVTAVDSSREALTRARARSRGNAAITFMVLPPPHEYDACVAFEVIEHLEDPEGFVAAINARHLIASAPVIPTVGINPYHRTDFTVASFRALLETRFDIRYWWVQVRPFHSEPSIAVFHGERRA